MQKELEPFVVYTSQVNPQVTSPAPSIESIQALIDATLGWLAKASDQLMRRLLEERDGKQDVDAHVSVSSSSGGSYVAPTNNPPSVTSAGSVPPLNTQTQPTGHYHSRTTIGGSAPMYGMPLEFMTGVSTSASLYSMPQHPAAAAYAPGSTSYAPSQAPTSAPTATMHAPNTAYNATAHAPSNTYAATTHSPNNAYNATAHAPSNTYNTTAHTPKNAYAVPQVTVPRPSLVTYAYGYPS